MLLLLSWRYLIRNVFFSQNVGFFEAQVRSTSCRPWPRQVHSTNLEVAFGLDLPPASCSLAAVAGTLSSVKTYEVVFPFTRMANLVSPTLLWFMNVYDIWYLYIITYIELVDDVDGIDQQTSLRGGTSLFMRTLIGKCQGNNATCRSVNDGEYA